MKWTNDTLLKEPENRTFLASVPLQQQKLVSFLRKTIAEAIPDAVEVVNKKNMLQWKQEEKDLFYLFVYQDYVYLTFKDASILDSYRYEVESVRNGNNKLEFNSINDIPASIEVILRQTLPHSTSIKVQHSIKSRG